MLKNFVLCSLLVLGLSGVYATELADTGGRRNSDDSTDRIHEENCTMFSDEYYATLKKRAYEYSFGEKHRRWGYCFGTRNR